MKKLIQHLSVSVNPLTGDLIGVAGPIVPVEEPRPVARPSNRIPPGGYTTPLW